MNSVELKNFLSGMIKKHFPNNEYTHGIIEAIMNQYMYRADYREENAIATMQGFIEHGVLNW